MVLSVNVTKAEQDALLGKLAEMFPAAEAVKSIRLDSGKVATRVKTPLGEVKVDVVLEVTDQG